MNCLYCHEDYEVAKRVGLPMVNAFNVANAHLYWTREAYESAFGDRSGSEEAQRWIKHVEGPEYLDAAPLHGGWLSVSEDHGSPGKAAIVSFVVEGIKTTVPLHKQILRDEAFRRGDFSTRFMEGFIARMNAAEAKS